MIDVLFQSHRYAGYLVALVVLVAAISAFGRARDAREFTPGPYVLAVVLLDLQVLLGLVLYGLGAYWEEGTEPEIAYLHPAIAFLALIVAHLSIRRARNHQMAVDAHRTAGRGLVTALVLIVVAILLSTFPGVL